MGRADQRALDAKPMLPYVVAVLGLAFVLRVAWALAVPVIPVSDAAAYAAFARTMAESGVFGWTSDEPFAFWPPGTTFLHAAVFWLFGVWDSAVVALNILLSLGCILLTIRLGSRFFGHRVGLCAGLVMALWPTLVLYPTVYASEIPFLFFSMLALDLWTSSRRPRLGLALVTGLCLGMAALIRPVALLLPFIFLPGLLLQAYPDRDGLKRVALSLVLAAVGMAIVIAPWTARNFALFGETVLISTNGGITLWMGNNPDTDGQYSYVPEELADVPDNEQARILSERAREYIQADPVAFVGRAFRKLLLLYGNESIGVAWNEPGIEATFGPGAMTPLKRGTQITWALIFLAACVGLLVAGKRHGWLVVLTSPLFLSVAYFSAVHAVVVAQDRYHLAFATQIAIFSAIGALYLFDRLRPIAGDRPVIPPRAS
ncbi:MAG: glycosyltransferase family 39 protein [Gammaproteobacteria bacterium]|nr:glycosyltransferase family 39 protein [Gammaproteobacteria bacterium]